MTVNQAIAAAREVRPAPSLVLRGDDPSYTTARCRLARRKGGEAARWRDVRRCGAIRCHARWCRRIGVRPVRAGM